jgi:nitrous oxidase accessory protein
VSKLLGVLGLVLLGGTLIPSTLSLSLSVYGEGQGEVRGPAALQEWISSAPPGAILRVPPGVYHGPIVIDKPLTLLGDGQAVLDGLGRGTVVHIIAPDVTVRGFVIKNSGRSLAHEDSGILVEAPRARIEENELFDVLFGIYLKNAPGSIIRANRVRGLDVPEAERGDALRLWYSSEVLIEGNQTYNARDAIIWYSARVTVRANRFQGGRYGVHLMYCKEITIESNLLSKNFVGVYAMYTQNLTLRQNLSLGHRGPSGYGIGLKDTDNAQIVENVIADNSVGAFIDNSPSESNSSVLFRRNLFAYNETAVLMFPSVRGDVFTENSFIENFEQVGIAGGGEPHGNSWTQNYWGDYLGYDADNDGIGDLVYKSERLFEHLIDRHPQLRLFLYSPAIQALEFAARALPIFKPQPKLTDPRPLMAPLLPTLALERLEAHESAPVGVIGALLGALGVIFGFGWGFLRRLAPKSPSPPEGRPLPQPLPDQTSSGLCALPPQAARRTVQAKPGPPSPLGKGAGGLGLGAGQKANPMIVVRGLTKRFGPVTAVEDLSFTVEAGEAVALWGPNGAGKSTVLHCLLGIVRYEGTIELGGCDPHRHRKAARRLVGFVPQQIHLPEDFTVREVVDFFARLKGASPETIPAVLERLGLAAHAEKRVGTLSGGMKQRVALAVALLGDPPILLLDEPTASLDAQSRSDFLYLLGELKRSGKTLLFSSHRQDEILSLADRVLILEQGRLVRIEQIAGRQPAEGTLALFPSLKGSDLS